MSGKANIPRTSALVAVTCVTALSMVACTVRVYPAYNDTGKVTFSPPGDRFWRAGQGKAPWRIISATMKSSDIFLISRAESSFSIEFFDCLSKQYLTTEDMYLSGISLDHIDSTVLRRRLVAGSDKAIANVSVYVPRSAVGDRTELCLKPIGGSMAGFQVLGELQRVPLARVEGKTALKPTGLSR